MFLMQIGVDKEVVGILEPKTNFDPDDFAVDLDAGDEDIDHAKNLD